MLDVTLERALVRMVVRNGEGQRSLRGTWLRCPLTIAPGDRVRVEESDNE